VRKEMASMILPVNEHVFRCHTDGFISDKEMNHLDIGTNLGQWKEAHTGRCYIENSCKVVWIEKELKEKATILNITR